MTCKTVIQHQQNGIRRELSCCRILVSMVHASDSGSPPWLSPDDDRPRRVVLAKTSLWSLEIGAAEASPCTALVSAPDSTSTSRSSRGKLCQPSLGAHRNSQASGSSRVLQPQASGDKRPRPGAHGRSAGCGALVHEPPAPNHRPISHVPYLIVRLRGLASRFLPSARWTVPSVLKPGLTPSITSSGSPHPVKSNHGPRGALRQSALQSL